MSPQGPASDTASPSAQERIHRLETLSRVANAIASELELDSIVQTVTDAATELTRAKFGAFFYNFLDAQGERFQLFTLSGAPRSAFEKFGMPRNTALFEPTFRGVGLVRSDDIRADPRYGKSAPHFGMPAGHLPVVSYLAVPVISRTGEVHGGLFFGHDQVGIFDQEAEDIAVAIAAQAAVALDNARLLQNSRQLAAIVESSDDAIMTKNLNSIITSWNDGARRLFGYEAHEIIGRPVTVLIPADRPNEEPAILDRLIRGERIDHYETIRQHKDGSLIDISPTVSPLKNAAGEVVGASKTARDITDRKRAQEQQILLLREMNHRIKNLFAVASGVVALSARSAETPKALARDVNERLAAPADAHDLTLPTGVSDSRAVAGQANLKALVATIVAPYERAAQITIDGPEIACGPKATTAFALLLYELATNSIKYGALSHAAGIVSIAWGGDETLSLTWSEERGPRVAFEGYKEGFGSVLVRASVSGLGGEMDREWRATGLLIRITVPMERLAF